VTAKQASGIIRNLRYDWPCHFVLRLTDWLPDNVLFLRLRGALLRPFLGSCGSNLRIGRGLTLYNPSRIHFGRDVYVAYGGWFMAGAEIHVGDEALFGPYCVVVSSNHTRRSGSYRYGRPDKQPIRIGARTWVAAHVTITAGSDIGDGALVAAGAVVRGGVAPDMMVGGVPARELGQVCDSAGCVNGIG